MLAGQDRKKFRGTDVSGVVALLCDHVFVWSLVDMQYGERYVFDMISVDRLISIQY